MDAEKNKVPTPGEMEAQIRRDVRSIRGKQLSKEQMEKEMRKYDAIYRAAVLDGEATAGVYMWREVYRRLLEECAWE